MAVQECPIDERSDSLAKPASKLVFETHKSGCQKFRIETADTVRARFRNYLSVAGYLVVREWWCWTESIDIKRRVKKIIGETFARYDGDGE